MTINGTGFDAPALYGAQELYAKLYGEKSEQVLTAFQDPAPHESAVLSRMIAYIKSRILNANLHFAGFELPACADNETFFRTVYGDEGEQILSAFQFGPREALVNSRMIAYLRAMLLQKKEA